MKTLDLFSGIAGISRALEMAGACTVAFCDKDPYCTEVLRGHYPDLPILDDVFNIDQSSLDKSCVYEDGIDVVCAGFPCQPFSAAGKRKGQEDERYLWPQAHRIITDVDVKWVLGENVKGLLSMDSGALFGNILWDLSSNGYRVGWGCYGAIDVGAPHQRDRVFIVGYKPNDKKTSSPPDLTQLVDWLTFDMWPATPGPEQYPWEPPRLTTNKHDRVARLRALGNAVVPAQCYPMAFALSAYEWVVSSGEPPPSPSVLLTTLLSKASEGHGVLGRLAEALSMRGFAPLHERVSLLEATLGLVYKLVAGVEHSESMVARRCPDGLWRKPKGGILQLLDSTGDAPIKWTRWGYVVGDRVYQHERRLVPNTASQAWAAMYIGGSSLAASNALGLPLWATPQALTTAGELPWFLVNDKGGTPTPGEKLYRSDSGRAVQTALTTQARLYKLWPTPTVQDSKNNGGPAQHARNTPPLNAVVKAADVVRSPEELDPEMRLNPDWVDQLMGLPIGWTQVDKKKH